MNERWVVVETTTRRGKRWHIRFQAGNSEPVVHGQNLKDRDSAHRAILSVARAHSITREAWLEQEGLVGHSGNPDRVVVGAADAFDRVYIPIVRLTEQPKRSRWSRRA
jgi:uncharacterized protein YegP (UPF0339 family)